MDNKFPCGINRSTVQDGHGMIARASRYPRVDGSPINQNGVLNVAEENVCVALLFGTKKNWVT